MERGDVPKAAKFAADRLERVAILGEDDERLAHAPHDSLQHVHLPFVVFGAPRRIDDALHHRALFIRVRKGTRHRQLEVRPTDRLRNSSGSAAWAGSSALLVSAAMRRSSDVASDRALENARFASTIATSCTSRLLELRAIVQSSAR